MTSIAWNFYDMNSRIQDFLPKNGRITQLILGQFYAEKYSNLYIIRKLDYIRSMCLELQFSRPRWRWVSAATIASDRYV